MNEKIAPLIRLQELDRTLDAARANVARMAPQRAALEAEKAARTAALDSSKKALTEALSQKKNLELDIDAKDQAVRKHSGELNNVKSNDAYKALLHEIEAAKTQKIVLEDQVLVLMEKIENFQKDAKASDATASQDQAALDQKIAAVDAEKARLDAAILAQMAERDAFAATCPPDARERYEAIQRGRVGFVAVVPVKDMTCGGCRTRLTADTVNQAMKGKDLVACDSCSRILFIPPKVEDKSVAAGDHASSSDGAVAARDGAGLSDGAVAPS